MTEGDVNDSRIWSLQGPVRHLHYAVYGGTGVTRREHFFSVLEGKDPINMPFVPDISDWYIAQRTPPGEAVKHSAGVYIPDEDPIHEYPGTMPEPYRDYTFLDFYREFNWGVHSHTGWFDIEYTGDVERVVTQTESEMRITLRTAKGDLVRVEKLAANQTWCPCEHFVKDIRDLEIMAHVVASQRYVPRPDLVEKALADIGDLGEIDLVISRSPFGKLVHEFMGFEKVIYALYDAPDTIHDFLKLQDTRDTEVMHLCAKSPGRLVIISDHADENLIAPSLYEEYCIPFYRKAAEILHPAGKFVSTHLDGNFKGFFPILGKTGFDLLDGCTPAPMFNYEVEELAAAMPGGMKAFCGVPASLFCGRRYTEKEIFEFGDRIVRSLQGRGIINVGDILPADGDIERVIALGRHVLASYR